MDPGGWLGDLPGSVPDISNTCCPPTPPSPDFKNPRPSTETTPSETHLLLGIPVTQPADFQGTDAPTYDLPNTTSATTGFLTPSAMAQTHTASSCQTGPMAQHSFQGTMWVSESSLQFKPTLLFLESGAWVSYVHPSLHEES